MQLLTSLRECYASVMTNQVPDIIDRNIAAIHDLRIHSDEHRRADQKFVDQAATFIGSTTSLYLHLVGYGAAVALNLVLSADAAKDFGLTGDRIGEWASLEAIFLAVFVLINQRRMNSVTRKHQDLHFQVTMLSEHEITKVARLLDEVAQMVGVTKKRATSVDDIKSDVHPNDILERIATHESARPTDLTEDNEATKK